MTPADAPGRSERLDPSLEDTLNSAFGPATSEGSKLVVRTAELAARADHAQLLDVAFRYLDSPYGRLLVAATEVGVVRLAFASEDHNAVLNELADTVSPRILEFPRRTDAAARQLDEYFARRRRAFDVTIDLRLVSGFRRDVVSHLTEIPYGTTSSYGELAAAVGNPRAVRAVGSACAHNPVPLIVPCHRVVRSDGTIGNYLGGTETKRSLLALEAA